MVTDLKVLFFLGRPFGPLYGMLMRIRERMYAKGLLPQHSLPVPVISVGNLVLGGTGKTPTVQYLTTFLLKHGYHPAIISRGYGGKAKLKVNVVSDGRAVKLSPEQAGDEPYMLASTLPGVPILTGVRRFHPCLVAIEDYNADIIILDDGFQHMSVRRDVDIVLFDGSELTGNSRIFPGGTLREPISALNRSDAFVITGITDCNRSRAGQFAASLEKRYNSKPVFLASLEGFNLHSPEIIADRPATGKPFFAFCGIANPGRFKDFLDLKAIHCSDFLALPDHVGYNQELVEKICHRASISGADKLITTRKDYVKLSSYNWLLPVYILEIKVQYDDGFGHFIMKSIKDVQLPGT